MRSLFLLSVLCVSAICLVSAATDLEAGASCTNADSCKAGFKCWANICSDQQTVDSPPSGFGNACDSTNCCPSESGELVCNDISRRCSFSTRLLAEVACDASGAGTTPAPAPPANTDPASGPQSDLALGARCANVDRCAQGLKCWANTCSDALAANSPPNGFGNACDTNDCCPQSAGAEPLVCNQASKRCTFSSSFLAEIACATGTPTTPTEPTPTPLPTPVPGPTPDSGAADGNSDPSTTPTTDPTTDPTTGTPTTTDPATTPTDPATTPTDPDTTPAPDAGAGSDTDTPIAEIPLNESSAAPQQASFNVFSMVTLAAAATLIIRGKLW